MVYQCTSSEDFKSKTASGPTIVAFTAAWSDSYKIIDPFFVKMSTIYTNIQFIKVDIDELDDISAEAGVSAMPSFFVYKNSAVVDQLFGANRMKLEDLCAKYN